MAYQFKLSQAVILSAEHLLIMLIGTGFLPLDLEDFLHLGKQDCIICSSLLLPQKEEYVLQSLARKEICSHLHFYLSV